MKLILTNYGHRYVQQSQNTDSVGFHSLQEILNQISVSYSDSERHNELIAAGYCKKVAAHVDNREIALYYRRNPLEHVSKIVFEYTTYCNFHCSHCRSGVVKRITETDVDKLKQSVDLFVPLGIRRFDFIGGEVTRYGDGWLDLAQYIQKQGEMIVAICTNGWWTGQKDFVAAGKRYANAEDYLADLKVHGVSHILFSIDGPEKLHDEWRGHNGLYRRIIDSFQLVKNAGIHPRTSLIVRGSNPPLDYAKNLEYISEQIYSFAGQKPLIKKFVIREDKNEIVEIDINKIQRIVDDPTNQLSNFIDINNGAQLREPKFSLKELPSRVLRCKAFFRPSPSLRIMASGEVGICPIINAGEKYGNIHSQDLLHIINNLQDTFVYKLHSENKIGAYREYLDTDVFGESFEHVCTLRVILTLIARKINERNITPDDKEGIRQINLEVAKITGNLIKTAQ